GELLGAEKVRLEEVVLDPDPHRQPVERQDLVAPADVHREFLVAAELGPAHSREDIEAARHGMLPAEERLARQEVVTHSQIVVRELPLTLGEQLDVAAQGLEAGAPGGGPAELGPQEEVFRHVIGEIHAVGRMGAEVLDRDHAEMRADLEVRALDPRCSRPPPLDFGTDGRRRNLRATGAVRRLLLRGFRAYLLPCRPDLGAMAAPVLDRGAARQREERRSGQKNTPNPSFHSSSTSLRSSLVKTT